MDLEEIAAHAQRQMTAVHADPAMDISATILDIYSTIGLLAQAVIDARSSIKLTDLDTRGTDTPRRQTSKRATKRASKTKAKPKKGHRK